MAVDIDTSKGLRGVADLQRLVVAVVGADEHDEPDWLEWKSTLDLSAKEGCFPVARAILGMANRTPGRAVLACEGLGYVVVGAEPGSCLGIATVDPATLTQLIEPYLGGADGPAWTPTYVPASGVTVLVVTVEAPRQGDPIFTLRREFDRARSGAVFVRKHGRTVPADASDMDALQARLVAAPPPTVLEVGLTGDVPVAWFDGATAPASLEAGVTDRADTLVAAARETERRRLAPKPVKAVGAARSLAALAENIAAQQSSMIRSMGVLGEADGRSLDDYIAEVEVWKETAIKRAPAVVLGRYVDAGRGVVAVTATNPTGRFLTDVEVEFVFEGDYIGGFEEAPELVELPPEPRPYGERTESRFLDPSLGLGASLLRAHLPVDFATPLRRTRIEVKQGSFRIRFHIGDLRQHGTDVSADGFILVRARPDDGILHGTWKATIRDQEGVVEGALEVPLCDESVDLVLLLSHQAENGDGST